MASTQVVTWRKYTAAEKWAFKARDRRRRMKRRWMKEQVFFDIYSGRKPNSEYLAALGWRIDL
jgi:hypothetical protein